VCVGERVGRVSEVRCESSRASEKGRSTGEVEVVVL
jgi:hypothetical protein